MMIIITLWDTAAVAISVIGEVMTSYSRSVLDNLIDKANSVGASIDVLPDSTNFMNLLNKEDE